jgi:hypothetical protein
MQDVARRLGGATVLDQHLGEASLIGLPGEGAAELRGRLLEHEQESAWANHWVLVAGVDDAALERARALVGLAAAPQHNQYMRQLEAANAELLRANLRMGRAWLGIHDAAAAVIVRKLEERNEQLHKALLESRSQARQWKGIADRNAYARELLSKEAQRARYRIVDSVFGAVARIPLLGRAARGGYQSVVNPALNRSTSAGVPNGTTEPESSDSM